MLSPLPWLLAAALILPTAPVSTDDKVLAAPQPRVIAECEMPIVCIASDEKGANLLVATERRDARLWSVAKGAFVWQTEPFDRKSTADDISKKVQFSVRALDLSSKYALVATGMAAPECFAVTDGKSTGGFITLSLDFEKRPVAALCDPRDRWVWVIIENGVIARYAPTDGVRSYSKRTMKDGSQPRCATLDADLGTLAIGCADGSVHFADMSSAKIDEDKVLKGSGSPLVDLEFANKGVLLVTGSEKGELTLWHVPTGKAKQTITASEAALTALAISPKGKFVATGDAKGVVKLWSLDKLEPLMTLPADGATKVQGLVFLDAGKSLAGALGGKSVVVWDVAKL